MQFRHRVGLNSVVVNLTGLMLSLAFSMSAQAADAVSSAEDTAKNVCSACHGVDGNSAITANPKLAGQHPEYLQKQLTEFK